MAKKFFALLVLCIVITTTMKLLVDAAQGTFDSPGYNDCMADCDRKKIDLDICNYRCDNWCE